QHKFEINRTFGNDAGLKDLFGYLLAMSRSRFIDGVSVNGCGVSSDSIGLWRLPPRVIQQYAPAGADSKQEVWIAANHFKDMLGSFDGDEGFMYAVACFGESSARAGEIVQRAPDPNIRRNFWNLGRTNVLMPDEVNRVVCFIAAGIVAENPQSFGLKSRP